jgi:hypothetical protein
LSPWTVSVPSSPTLASIGFLKRFHISGGGSLTGTNATTTRGRELADPLDGLRGTLVHCHQSFVAMSAIIATLNIVSRAEGCPRVFKNDVLAGFPPLPRGWGWVSARGDAPCTGRLVRESSGRRSSSRGRQRRPTGYVFQNSSMTGRSPTRSLTHSLTHSLVRCHVRHRRVVRLECLL